MAKTGTKHTEKSSKKPSPRQSKSMKWWMNILMVLGLVGFLVVGFIAFRSTTQQDDLDSNNSQDVTLSLAEQFAEADVDPEAGEQGLYKHLLNTAGQFKLEGEYAKAADFYQQAREIFPNDEYAQGEVAVLSYSIYQDLNQTNNFQQYASLAVSWLVGEYEANGEIGALALDIARLYEELNDNNNAALYYQKLLEDETVTSIGELSPEEFTQFLQSEIERLQQ